MQCDAMQCDVNGVECDTSNIVLSGYYYTVYHAMRYDTIQSLSDVVKYVHASK